MFRDTSMDYLTLEEINQNIQLLPDEDFLAMDESEFRARVRERSHHSLEIQMYHAAYRNEKLKASQADYVKHLLELWRKRGLAQTCRSTSTPASSSSLRTSFPEEKRWICLPTSRRR